MSMFSEITTERNIKAFVSEIEKALNENKGKSDTCAALKKLGRFALSQFEWNSPKWAKKYERLFRE
jgi:hypothetical protein